MEFEIKGVQYRTVKLSVFDQLKVSRKLLPVLAGMLADFQGIKAAAEGWKPRCQKSLIHWLA